MLVIVIDEPSEIGGDWGFAVTVDPLDDIELTYSMMKIPDPTQAPKRSDIVEAELVDDKLVLVGPSGREPNPVEAAIVLAMKYGGIDGGHHKMWVIDQMVRTLVGERYQQLVSEYEAGEDGPETYEWDTGIAP